MVDHEYYYSFEQARIDIFEFIEVTTDSKHNQPIADNLLGRNFHENRLGKKWVSDITYIRVSDKWAYLTTMIDLADRKVIGWSLSEDMTTENTVLKAWVNARNNRDIEEGFLLHSDRGVQYSILLFTSILSENPTSKQSMSRKGDCWDNAVAESFFKSIKYEYLYRFNFQSIEHLNKEVTKYIYWNNNKRLHSALGYKTPAEKENELKFMNLERVA
ncbi:hypothetical protein AVL50_11650 [Flammeovirga sp. SJP92]|nr:IS3 family transposase [Flammeovirga sp. SJP92]KXX70383.1 hypothetical protein AVL50_11650 [Flammeovirga sp. SJP92]